MSLEPWSGEETVDLSVVLKPESQSILELEGRRDAAELYAPHRNTAARRAASERSADLRAEDLPHQPADV